MKRREFLSDQLTIDSINEKYASNLKATAYYIIKDRNPEKTIRKQNTERPENSERNKDSNSERMGGVIKGVSNINDAPTHISTPSSIHSASAVFPTKIKLPPITETCHKTKSAHCNQVLPPTIKKDSEQNMKISKPQAKNSTLSIPKQTSSKKKIHVITSQIKHAFPAKVKKETGHVNTLQKKVSTIGTSNVGPSQSIPTQTAPKILTKYQKTELLRSLKQKGLPPIQPWKPGKIPNYKFNGRLKDLEEILDNVLLETICDGNKYVLDKHQKAMENTKQSRTGLAAPTVNGKSSVYAPLRCKEDDSIIRKGPRRAWTTWNFKTQWPMPF